MLSLKNVSKRFGGVVAVDAVSLDVRAGEVHALIGPNGAGKTTLIGLISGSLPGNEGEMLFLENSLMRWKAHDRVREGVPVSRSNLPKPHHSSGRRILTRSFASACSRLGCL